MNDSRRDTSLGRSGRRKWSGSYHSPTSEFFAPNVFDFLGGCDAASSAVGSAPSEDAESGIGFAFPTAFLPDRTLMTTSCKRKRRGDVLVIV